MYPTNSRSSAQSTRLPPMLTDNTKPGEQHVDAFVMAPTSQALEHPANPTRFIPTDWDEYQSNDVDILLTCVNRIQCSKPGPMVRSSIKNLRGNDHFAEEWLKIEKDFGDDCRLAFTYIKIVR